MASNRTRNRGRQISVVPTDGGVNPGDPCIFGKLPGVSLNGQTVVNGLPSATTPQTIDTEGVYALSVKGVVTGGGSGAINSGDDIYYVPGATPKLSAQSDGTGAVLFGTALGVQQLGQSGYPAGVAVASGATTTIDVRLRGANA